ncbi:hypothetical protein DYB26_000261 [Aphanomyces astaci]|uniref:DNA topoisomerase n=1 Tax=Aphanomyces astaci TaxID=112090 RepID=A0A418EPC1_APHAT|nr:hypothetical protein DYB26_000261 [Aphanomyces astaci]
MMVIRSWKSCDPVELFTAKIEKKVRGDQKPIEATLRTEAARAQWLVLWLDCDREGENIAFEVKSVCENVNRRLRVFRARFSALIPRDIQHAVQHLVQPNENLSLACDARSEIDLRLGAAFTRFQTMRIQKKFPRIHTQNAASSSSSSNTDNKVVSFGSCQFPTLGFVVDRFLAIEAFVSEPFYSIHVAHAIPDVGSIAFTWARHRLYDHVATLALFETCVEAKVATVTSITRKDTSKRKPFPLTTVEFQKRASRYMCPYVVHFIGVAWNTPGDMMLLTEFMNGGDLRQVLELTPPSFQWVHKLRCALSVAEGLVYLHLMDPKVIHRDLKSRNVLLDSDFNAKITDFGIARETDDATMTAGIGTFRWMAPEVLLDGHYTEKADIFSFGVILAELSTNIVPYSDLRNDKGNVYMDTAIMAKVMTGELIPTFASDCPRWYLDVATACLALDPLERPTAMKTAYTIRRQVEGCN